MQKCTVKVGDKFGRLEVIEEPFYQFMERPSKSQNISMARCRCDCGDVDVYKVVNLKTGKTKSCGCYHSDVMTEWMGKLRRSHQMSGARIYKIWAAMLARCRNPNCKAYVNYGGRGITVTPEWLSFEAFHDWAMDNGYRDDLSIERKNVNGNYCKENVCFIPRREQAYNKTTTVNLTALGETKCITLWSRDSRCVVHLETLYRRMSRGWAAEAAITTPGYPESRKDWDSYLIFAFGESKTVSSWMADPRCKAETIERLYERLRKGENPEVAITRKPQLTGSALIAACQNEITAWGETKSIFLWAKDERSNVTPKVLLKRIEEGKMTTEEAIRTFPPPRVRDRRKKK